MNYIILQYSFMFDPSETWTKLSSFEDDLAKFFKERGIQAKVVSQVGQSANRIILLEKIQEIPIPTPDLTVKQNLKNLRDPKTYTYQNSYGRPGRSPG